MFTLKKIIIVSAFSLLSACSEPDVASQKSYDAVDSLFNSLKLNVQKTVNLTQTHEIDHSRLGKEAGGIMPPSRVLIFSDEKLDSELIQLNAKVALDLPLRVLAYQDIESGEASIIYNNFEYLKSRYQLGEQPKISVHYQQSIDSAISGIPTKNINAFNNNAMQPDGITTITSAYDFETTKSKVLAGIASQGDAVSFGEIDFQARAINHGISLRPNTLLLFGGPAPGAKAMKEAPTLGLDAFCQKFLLWQDKSGTTHLSFNDLLAAAERQDTNKSLALRVINYRLSDVFEDALK